VLAFLALLTLPALLLGLLLFGPLDFRPGEEASPAGADGPAAPDPVALAREGLPAECVGAEGAVPVGADGRFYFNRIAYVLKDGGRVELMLVPRARAADPPTFYIMEDKVWVDLFRRFARDKPAFVRNADWELGGLASGRYLQNPDGRHPVLGVAVQDAYHFARWLGGNLPTAAQWDKAAGRLEAGAGVGPYLGPWFRDNPTAVAVNRAGHGPLPVGRADRDVSPFGCRDMAGNGREWTCDLYDPRQERHVPCGPDSSDQVVLRGRSYAAAGPLAFRDLEGQPETQGYQQTSPFTGFRVVIEPRSTPPPGAR
jgi:hypothetical protein